MYPECFEFCGVLFATRFGKIWHRVAFPQCPVAATCVALRPTTFPPPPAPVGGSHWAVVAQAWGLRNKKSQTPRNEDLTFYKRRAILFEAVANRILPAPQRLRDGGGCHIYMPTPKKKRTKQTKKKTAPKRARKTKTSKSRFSQALKTDSTCVKNEIEKTSGEKEKSTNFVERISRYEKVAKKFLTIAKTVNSFVTIVKPIGLMVLAWFHRP